MADVFTVSEVGNDDSEPENEQSGTDSCEESDPANGCADGTMNNENDPADADELLSPVARLEKFSNNEIIFNRQAVARNVVDTLRSVAGNDEEVTIVLTVLEKLSKDPESQVRAEVMEQVPHIAVFCNEIKQLNYVITQYLVPMIVQYFTDSNEVVRKTSQAALLVLFEQGLLEKAVIEEQVCPVIFQLIEPDCNDCFRTEGVALMIKLATLVGTDLTLKIFLNRFSALCTDSLYLVRKVCAANFGDFCCMVGFQTTEKVLLPKFGYLCEDGVWEVRKACSEVFMSVSCACSLETRKNELAPLFINLLCDPSRWVKNSAFKALGPFISTFADPSITGLYYKEDGVICVTEPAEKPIKSEDLEEEENKTTQESSKKRSNDSDDQDVSIVINNECDKNLSDDKIKTEDSSQSMNLSSSPEGPEYHVYDAIGSDGEEESMEERLAACNEDSNEDKSKSEIEEETSQSSSVGANNPCDNQSVPSENVGDEETAAADEKLEESLDSYESFNYWRVPVPQIELDADLVASNQLAKLSDSTVGNEAEDKVHNLISELRYTTISEKSNFRLLNDSTDSLQRTYRVQNSDADSAIGTSPSGLSSPFNEGVIAAHYESISHHQDIVPQDLLDNFVSMTDPAYITTIDTEITRHCAYSIPAVTLTLGRNHWPCLKKTYEALSSDIQWKVRHTLASSIHELALILGDEIATKDLIPIFNGFIKDLDEVRIGILQHLAIFLKLLKEQDRRDYLPKLAEFIKTDNERNWRFRHELAQQLLTVPELYSPAEVKEYIVPITLCLVNDKVSEVRKKAYQVMAVILKHLAQTEDLVTPVLYDLTNQFCRSSRWLRRQIYALLCHSILEHMAVPLSVYATEVLPHLLHLSWDPVPNVRIAVAQCISCGVLKSEYLTSSDLKYHEFLMDAVKVLQEDSDRDVYFYANIKSFDNYYAMSEEPKGCEFLDFNNLSNDKL